MNSSGTGGILFLHDAADKSRVRGVDEPSLVLISEQQVQVLFPDPLLENLDLILVDLDAAGQVHDLLEAIERIGMFGGLRKICHN